MTPASPLLHPQVTHAPVAPVGSPVGSSLSLIPEDGLPPILISTGVKGGTGGHITGACPHPHHSAASSLLRQLMCLCLSCVLYHGSCYDHSLPTRGGADCTFGCWNAVNLWLLTSEHHFPSCLTHSIIFHSPHLPLHRFFLSVYLTLFQLHPFLYPSLLLLFPSTRRLRCGGEAVGDCPHAAAGGRRSRPPGVCAKR